MRYLRPLESSKMFPVSKCKFSSYFATRALTWCVFSFVIGFPGAARIQLQAEIQKATSSTSMVHGLDDQQSQCIDMYLEEKESVSVHTEVPTFINLSSDPAGLILDALRNCLRSNLSGNKSPHLLAKSFYRLLEHLTAVSLEIKPNVKERACEFFLEWKAKSIGSHMWETLGRLQLIAAYQLSSSFSSNQIFCLLEMVHPPKKVASLIRILGLVEKVPGNLNHATCIENISSIHPKYATKTSLTFCILNFLP